MNEPSQEPKRLYAKVTADGVDDIVGKMLTYADMSFPDKQQREAFKSMTKSAIWSWWHNYELFADESTTTFSGDIKDLKVTGGTQIIQGTYTK